jgi:hypothetical protein
LFGGHVSWRSQNRTPHCQRCFLVCEQVCRCLLRQAEIEELDPFGSLHDVSRF